MLLCLIALEEKNICDVSLRVVEAGTMTCFRSDAFVRFVYFLDFVLTEEEEEGIEEVKPNFVKQQKYKSHRFI